MTKSNYISACLYGRGPFRQLQEAALIFYHCDIGLLPAKTYLDRLEKKLRNQP